MLKPHASVLLIYGLLVACAPETTAPEPVDRPDWQDTGRQPQDTGTQGEDTDTQQEDKSFLESGTWVTTDEYLPMDGCEMADWVTEGPGGEIEVVQTGDTRFTITHSRGTETCTIAGDKSFSCEPYERLDTTPQDEYSLDAVLVMTLTSSGSLPSADKLLWDTAINVDCNGNACWAVSLATSSFPCSMKVHVDAKPR